MPETTREKPLSYFNFEPYIQDGQTFFLSPDDVKDSVSVEIIDIVKEIHHHDCL